MLKINSLTLNQTTQAHLNAQQTDIDNQATYQDQVERAQSLWNSKKSSYTKEQAFAEIELKLTQNAIGKHYCNYCEHNLHSDIEHFYPKSLYPNKTFVWDNYLWACKKCNTDHKLAKFKIFVPLGSNNPVDITPQQRKQAGSKTATRVYTIPQNEDSVLINPRVDDPMDYLYLDLQTGRFVLNPQNKSPRANDRFEYTCNVLLKLNGEGLLKARLNTYNFFYQQLKNYINVQQVTTLDQLANLIAPTTANFTSSLEKEKTRICLNIQRDISTSIHLTVWKEMQRQHSHYPHLQHLFNQAPEALTW